MRQILVDFEGEGSGDAELTWGQREILGAMRRQQTRMPLPARVPLPPGTTLEDRADWLRYIMRRHQSMRTRLVPGPDGTLRQVVSSSGVIAMDIIEAGDEDPAVVSVRTLEWRDRYVEREFDFATEWPVFMAVVLKDGVPSYQIFTMCHIVADAFGVLALIADLADREAGVPEKPVTAMQPLEQARWQQSPEGERHAKAVLRHWADVLHQMPARRFPAPVDRGEPRYWRLHLFSPATDLAVQIIRNRTGASGAYVILTAFLTALAQVTGTNPSFTRVAVNNRFRRGLADSVSIVAQYGLCLVDVDGVPFDEALTRVGRRMLGTLKNSYYDPVQVHELVERIGRERGEDVDIECYYNDRRLSQEAEVAPDTVPAAAEVLAARRLTTLDHGPLPRGAERLFVAVEEAPGTFHLLLEADTHHFSREAMAACARAVEDIAVAAATVPG